MSWTVTIEVADCNSPSTVLQNAKIEMGTVQLGFTDASGRYLATLQDADITPIFTISLQDYIKGNVIANKETNSGGVLVHCLNNPSTIPDGQDPNIPGKSGGEEFGGGCFIVTAATGSSASEEVIKLRQLRQRVRSASTLGGALIDAIYNEYEQFSPKIAADLELDDLSRMTVLEIIVKPLFAWYTLAGKLALDHADQEIISQDVQTLLAAVPQGLGQHILEKLELIQKGEALPAGTPAQLVELGSRIVHFPFASWAILNPLIRVYRLVTDNNDVVDEIAQWLANAPVEELSRPNDPNLLLKEFSALAAFFDFKPAARPQLGERLLAAWPEAALALEQSGFISNLVNKL